MSYDDHTEVRMLPMQQSDAVMVAFALVTALRHSEVFRDKFADRSLIFVNRLIELAEEGSNANA